MKKETSKKPAKAIKSSDDKKITKDMAILDVVQKYPQTMGVFFAYGLHCVGCHVAATESLQDGAMAHGIEGNNFDKLLKDLNNAADKAK